jgi:pyrroline-5-carboxylate reductase
MLSAKKIGFIGGGNMAAALIGGLVQSGTAPAQNIICSEPRQEARHGVQENFGVVTTDDNLQVIRQSEIVVYAVKPQALPEVLRQTEALVDGTKLLISIAAGVPLAAIAEGLAGGLGDKARLIRVMPNICALAGESATAIAAGAGARPGDAELAKAIFDAVGTSVIMAERLLDAFTGLCGSGPAYTFLIIEALADAGVNMGLGREDALALAAQTLYGSAKMVLSGQGHPAQLKDRVCSPGGTSIAGVHALEQGGLRATLMNAVAAATARSRELGRS